MRMHHRAGVSAWVAMAIVVTVGVWPCTVAAQGPAAEKAAPVNTRAAATWKMPRLPWGDPDLQGVWTTLHFGRVVPLERPPQYAGKVELTQEEAEARYNRNIDQLANIAGGVGTYGREWRDTEGYLATLGIKNSRRTSQVIDPPDGRIPFTADARKRLAAEREAARRPRPVRGVEDIPSGRCLPNTFWMVSHGIDNGKRIVQGPGYVVILYELGPPNVRVIPVAGQPSPTIPQWWGQPRGHWEGNTLVVETTHYNGRGTYQGAGEYLRVVERFTRTSDTEIDYQYTVEDSTAFTRPWTVAINWLQYPGLFDLVEYACHEGNYSLPVILRAAQMETEKTGVWIPVQDSLETPAEGAATKKTSP